ncbi:MAG: DNA internalization-related competence protein ComEC/Rec2 [Acidobacteriota bacterium]
MTPSIRGNLQRAGLFHLVALSGLHVGLLLLLLYGAAALLRLHPRVRDFACLVILGGYGLVVGTHPSLLRALLMAGIYLVAKILGRPQAGWRAWLFTLILLLLVRPAWAMDTGFQLTFAATLGILLMMPLYPARLPRGGWSGQVLKFFWMGFAAQLFVLPILADAFHRVSWSGWLATPLASLPIFPLLATGLLYMAGGAFVPGLHTVLGMLLSLFARIFMWLPFHLGAIQHAGFFVVEPWAGWILLYFCALGLIVSLPRAWKGSGWAMAALLLCGAWCFPRPFEPPPRPEMAVLDVGQASCQVVLSPRSTFLVDAGTPGYKGRTSASSVIEPFLAREGVRHIDGVILTHWDSDHSGALPDLLRDIPIGWIAYPATDPPRSGLPAQIAALCRRRGVPLQPLHRYETMGTGRLSWDILNPSIRTPLPGENNRCIVAQTLLGRVSFLFTGDIEARAESDLVARRLAPPAQVLVAPHHGSKTSSTPRWLAHVRPLFVCFSVGRRNRYGHPAPEIVDRYKNMRAEISRTDRDGGVLMVPRGGLVSVFRMRNGDWSSRLYGVK